MAEENNTDEVETEEKSLEDQLAALEEVAASLGEDTEIKSDHSAEECEDDDCEEHGTKDASDEDASAEDAETKDDAPAEDAPEENMEEKVAGFIMSWRMLMWSMKKQRLLLGSLTTVWFLTMMIKKTTPKIF
jgi:hypothetical protein